MHPYLHTAPQTAINTRWPCSGVQTYVVIKGIYIYIGEVDPRTGHEGPDGVGGQLHVPAPLPPGKTRYPLYGRLGGPQSRFGQVRKISHSTRIRSPDRSPPSQSLQGLQGGSPRMRPFHCTYVVIHHKYWFYEHVQYLSVKTSQTAEKSHAGG